MSSDQQVAVKFEKGWALKVEQEILTTQVSFTVLGYNTWVLV